MPQCQWKGSTASLYNLNGMRKLLTASCAFHSSVSQLDMHLRVLLHLWGSAYLPWTDTWYVLFAPSVDMHPGLSEHLSHKFQFPSITTWFCMTHECFFHSLSTAHRSPGINGLATLMAPLFSYSVALGCDVSMFAIKIKKYVRQRS